MVERQGLAFAPAASAHRWRCAALYPTAQVEISAVTSLS